MARKTSLSVFDPLILQKPNLPLATESPVLIKSFKSQLNISDLVPAEQVIDIGRQAHMQCLTEERDRATILWRKDGMTLQSSTRVIANQQTLQIFNLQREDYGVYQCFVSRGSREVQATAQLRLGGI